MRRQRQLLRLQILLLVVLNLSACASLRRIHPAPPDPLRFQDEIAAYEAQDRRALPPTGAIVCAGSSSMRLWQDRIQRDLAPLTIIPRGFGGSTMDDLLYYLDRIVIRYQPRAVVIYEGDNDMALQQSPRHVLRAFRKMVRRIHKSNPRIRIYVLSVKPSESRWAIWPQTQTLNALLQHECRKTPLMTYIDVAAPLLDSSGRPDNRYFQNDKLHLNAAGYDRWRDTIRPVLMQSEMRFEK